MNDILITIFILIIITLLISSCSNRDETSAFGMPETQYKALNKRITKSTDIKKSLQKVTFTLLKSKQEPSELNTEKISIDSLTFSLPPSIKVPKAVETENYWLIYNVILSPPDSNIAKFDKEGNYLSKFARKGRGPSEVTKIDAIAEKNHVIYLSDNGSLKKFDRKNEQIEQKLLQIWAHDIRLHEEDYDLRSSANEVFSFPIYTLDSKTDTIVTAINDDRKDVFNYTSSNNTTFYSNDSLIIYAKTPTNNIHFYSKVANKFVKHFKIEADFIRKNTEVLPEQPSKSKFMSFYNSLFLIDKIHLFDNRLFLTFTDRNNGTNNYFLATADISFSSDKGGRELPLNVYQTNNFFKTAYFYEDHLYFYSPSKNERNLKVFSIKLEEL